MKLPILNVIISASIFLTSCSGGMEKPTFQKDENRMEDLKNYLPCGDSTYYKLLSVNVTNSDFSENGRTHTLLTMHGKLRRNGIVVRTGILVGESEYTPYMKRLSHINGFDSIITVLSDASIEKIKASLKTRHPMTIFVNGDNSHIETGQIDRPVFKQKIYDYLYDKPKSILLIKDTVLRIKSNTDTIIGLKNTGDEKLYIYDIDSSCECNKVSVDKTSIDKGETVQLYVEHKSNGKAKVRTNILIYSNDIDGIKEIVLEAQN